MPTTDFPIKRDDVASLISEGYATNILEAARQGSTALAAFPTIPLGTKVTHLPVLATLPEAGWVGDTDNKAVKPVAGATWESKTLVAEEVAVQIPIHEDTVADCTVDILSALAAQAGQAIGKKLDQAVFFGVDKPTSWTSTDLLAAATAAGAVSQVAADNDPLAAFYTVAGQVAATGANPSTIVTGGTFPYTLANLRDKQGGLLLPLGSKEIPGFANTFYSLNGAWDATKATAFVVDPTLVRIGVRQDVTVKLITDALEFPDGTIIGLASRDMVALRVVARYAYVLGEPAVATDPSDAVIKASAAGVVTPVTP
jgi:HK97 family phage major capsid protein